MSQDRLLLIFGDQQYLYRKRLLEGLDESGILAIDSGRKIGKGSDHRHYLIREEIPDHT